MCAGEQELSNAARRVKSSKNSCLLPEICNGCDDNQNGHSDEGLYKCSTGAFSQIACPQTTTPVPYNCSGPGTVPPKTVSGGNVSSSTYANNWKLFANSNVATIALKVGPSGFTVPAGDYFGFAGQAFQNTLPPGTSIQKNVAGTIQSGIAMQFFSDSTEPPGGQIFQFDEVTVSCGTSITAPTPVLQQSLRHEGLLLGTGDTLFFTLPGGPEDIFIWTTGTGGDADLYVRTGATPTKNIYNQRSALASTSNEAVRIVGNTSGATHFVAVTSYSGAASFALRFSRAKPSNIWSQRVGLAFPATSTQLTTIRSMVKQNMQKFFGASEGQIVISSATITNNIGDSAGNCGNCAGGPCNVCIKATPPPPPPGLAANCAAGLVTLFSTEWKGVRTPPLC